MNDPKKSFNLKTTILVRVYGENTEVFIDRKQELLNMVHLGDMGLCPPLYGSFVNGFVYGYAEGKPFTVDDFRNPIKSRIIARKVGEFHQIDFPGDKKSRYFLKIREWMKKVPKKYNDPRMQEKFESEIDMKWIKLFVTYSLCFVLTCRLINLSRDWTN